MARFRLPPYAILGGKPVRPHARQAEFHKCEALYKYFRGGAGSGKSLAGAWEFLRRIMSNAEYISRQGLEPGINYIAGAPTAKLVKFGPWAHMLRIIRAAADHNGFSLLAHKPWETPPQRLELITGDTIYFVTLQDAEMFAAMNAGGAWYDEAELAPNPMEGWNALSGRVRDPRLPPERQFMLATSTPCGYRGLTAHFADMEAANNPQYAVIQAKNSDNPSMTEEYRRRLSSGMSERERRQVLDGALETEDGAVYGLEFDPSASIDQGYKWGFKARPGHEYFWAIDWGGSYHGLLIEHSRLIPGTERVDPLGGYDTVFDEVVMDDVQDEAFLEELRAKTAEVGLEWSDLKAWADYNPRDAVYLANQKRFFDGRCYTRRVGPDADKESGINTVRGRLLDYEGKRRLRFAPALRHTDSERRILRCMTSYKRLDATVDGQTVRLGVNQKSPWSHGPDALRAYCWPRYVMYRISSRRAA